MKNSQYDMKYLSQILITFIIITLVACSGGDGHTIPEDLEGKKVFLSEKQSELRELQTLIGDLEEQIAELDPVKEKDPISVHLKKIIPQEFKRFIKVQANVVADDVINISSELGGRITKLNVKEGQYVKKGKLVATTDMQIVENQIAEVQTALSLANTVYDRQKRLWEKNIGSEIQYLESKNNKERLEKSLDVLKSQISKKHIYSPINGVVDHKFLSPGEMAAPGVPIVQLMNTHNIKIKADLQESLLGKIKVGDNVEVYFPALDKLVTRKVSMIGRTIDMSNRTFEIEITSTSQNGQLKPNLLAEVSINDYTKQDALIIPTDAVKEEVSGKKYIYIIQNVDGQPIARKSYVELGESDEGSIVIEAGINPGDEIVIEGSENLSDNDPVLNTLKSE